MKNYILKFSGNNSYLLHKYNIGLEKEMLRVDKHGNLSKLPHPCTLGSPLTHPLITTDFAESQLELLSKPYSSIRQLYRNYELLHAYVCRNLYQDELLWNASMPCRIDNENEIRIAEYGSSNPGRFKHIYRVGLSHRYDKVMQMISGIHFNFSFSKEMIDFLYHDSGKKQEKSRFVSELYLAISRNLLRIKPLTTYLFGCSPVFDKSFLKCPPYNLSLTKQSYYSRYATSFRMSDIGYTNNKRCKPDISYNSIDSYIASLNKKLITKSPFFDSLGLVDNNNEYKQLNNNILQIEAEYYNLVRPKPVNTLSNGNFEKNTFLSISNKRPIELLRDSGIEYIEFRGVDINPNYPLGISEEDIYFLHLIFLYALFKESPEMSKQNLKQIVSGQNQVAYNGRNKSLSITWHNREVNFAKWAVDTLEEMRQIAEILDKNGHESSYVSILNKKIEKVNNPDITPSAICFNHMLENNISYREHVLERSKKDYEYFRNIQIPYLFKKYFDGLTKQSIRDQLLVEINDEISFLEYLKSQSCEIQPSRVKKALRVLQH